MQRSGNRYNQVPNLTQDTNGKVTNSQPDTTNENQEVSPFPAGDHKAHTNRRAQKHIARPANRDWACQTERCHTLSNKTSLQ